MTSASSKRQARFIAARKAKGYVRTGFMLSPEIHQALKDRCEVSGLSQQSVIEALILGLDVETTHDQ